MPRSSRDTWTADSEGTWSLLASHLAKFMSVVARKSQRRHDFRPKMCFFLAEQTPTKTELTRARKKDDFFQLLVLYLKQVSNLKSDLPLRS